MPEMPVAPDPECRRLLLSHLRNGWLGLLAFAVLGVALEALHAFKSFAYLGVGNETRRLMWTLAHAHGIGLSLVQIAFAVSLQLRFTTLSATLRFASRALNWALLLIPVGFFLGGVAPYEGDPGLGVLLVPVGALLLMAALTCVARELTRRTP